MRTKIKRLLVWGLVVALVCALSLFASTAFSATELNVTKLPASPKILKPGNAETPSIWNPYPPPGLPRVAENPEGKLSKDIWNPYPPPGLPRISIWNPYPPPGLPRLSIWNPYPPPGLPRISIWNPYPPPGLPR